MQAKIFDLETSIVIFDWAFSCEWVVEVGVDLKSAHENTKGVVYS